MEQMGHDSAQKTKALAALDVLGVLDKGAIAKDVEKKRNQHAAAKELAKREAEAEKGREAAGHDAAFSAILEGLKKYKLEGKKTQSVFDDIVDEFEAKEKAGWTGKEKKESFN